ncbi:MAG: alpha/beta fold hydrolase [Patescibacteria group bacterium]
MRMNIKKCKIKNRKGQKVVVLVEENKKAKGLAFVMHGLSGCKEEPHLEAFAKAFRDHGYSVIRFDTTNTLGESEGELEKATLTNYYEDLEDVIKWSSGQNWYTEPFVLAGHSLGGGSSILYSEKYPHKVKGLAPISTFISRKLSFDNYTKKDLEEWKKKGYHLQESTSKPGLIKKYSWKLMEDLSKYDFLKNVNKLIMPVLLICGSKDDGIPVKYQKILYNKLPGTKELHIIKDAPHTFTEKKHLDEIKKIFIEWIKKL